MRHRGAAHLQDHVEPLAWRLGRPQHRYAALLINERLERRVYRRRSRRHDSLAVIGSASAPVTAAVAGDLQSSPGHTV